jgi:two-component system sensor histidine kinase BaeS
MKRMFITILFALLSALVIFIVINTSVFYFGFKNSVAGWERSSGKSEHERLQTVIEVLFSQHETDSQELTKQLKQLLPQGIPVEIYDADKHLLYHNDRPRGYGRRRQSAGMDQLPVQEIQVNGKTIGYMKLGTVAFGSNRANSRFLESMKKTVLYAIISAFVLAFTVAVFFSRRLAHSAGTVAAGIDQLAKGKLKTRIPKTGIREISDIAESANVLGEQLQREEELRKQWASDIAHDLRTPITALKTQFEGMIDGVLDMSAERISENMKEIERIESLVRDLAMLTKLESPEYIPDTGTVSTDKLLHDLRARFEPQCRKKSITLETKTERLKFKADEQLVFRAVSNLFSNALRHTPEKGTISILIKSTTFPSPHEPGTEIRVFNSGSFITTAETKKIFDRLYRGEFARHTSGSGLGLTIAKKIAELHNGSLHVESAPEKGTTFRLFIGA